MRIKSLILAALCMVTVGAYAQSNYPFNGLDMNMGNLSRLSDAKTRSISPENFTGEKGKGGMADPVRDKDQRNVANAHHAAKDLGKGWKVNPFIIVKPGETITIAEIEGPGAIQQIWMTPTGNWRFSILRMYWDDEKEPSVECPVGDFFCSAYNEYAQLSSLAVCVNPGSAFNCYWKMPFRKKARITLENINTAEEMRLYYQVNYTLTEVPEDEAYFHAQFRRSNPTQGSLHTLIDGVKGKGQYVGTYMAWRVNDNCWWGKARSSSTWTATRNTRPSADRGRGLLLRLVQFREPEDAPVPGVHHPLRRHAPGDPSRRAVPCGDSFRAIPLAHTRPGAIRQGPEGNHTGPGMAPRRTLQQPEVGHLLDHLLVPDRAACKIPKSSEQGRTRNTKMVRMRV